MKRITTIVATAVVVLSMLLVSCRKETIEMQVPSVVQPSNKSSMLKSGTASSCNNTKVVPLRTDNHLVGNATIVSEADSISVTVNTSGVWVLSGVYVFAGSKAEFANVRTRFGYPVYVMYPYQFDIHPTGGYETYASKLLKTKTFKIPKSNLGDCFYVSVMGLVTTTEEIPSGDGGFIGLPGSFNQVTAGDITFTYTGFGNDLIPIEGLFYTTFCKDNCCTIETKSYDIMAGQTTNAGSLDVTNTDDSLIVTYNTNNNWYIAETHLYVGELNGLPANRSGAPMPGQFPYKTQHRTATNSVVYKIALNSLPECYIIAAHSELVRIENGAVKQKETGWSYGTPFNNANRWGWYSSYCNQKCSPVIVVN